MSRPTVQTLLFQDKVVFYIKQGSITQSTPPKLIWTLWNSETRVFCSSATWHPLSIHQSETNGNRMEIADGTAVFAGEGGENRMICRRWNRKKLFFWKWAQRKGEGILRKKHCFEVDKSVYCRRLQQKESFGYCNWGMDWGLKRTPGSERFPKYEEFVTPEARELTLFQTLDKYKSCIGSRLLVFVYLNFGFDDLLTNRNFICCLLIRWKFKWRGKQEQSVSSGELTFLFFSSIGV